jgi:HPt (histidine-containing phosphotransfer) domain-containing protein
VLPLRALRELLDEDEDALHEALATFLESIADVRAGVRAAMHVHDMSALAFHAHRFKSAAGQIEATGCYRLCALFKDLPREADPAVHRQAERLVEELLAALDELEPAIRDTMASLRS